MREVSWKEEGSLRHDREGTGPWQRILCALSFVGVLRTSIEEPNSATNLGAPRPPGHFPLKVRSGITPSSSFAGDP